MVGTTMLILGQRYQTSGTIFIIFQYLYMYYKLMFILLFLVHLFIVIKRGMWWNWLLSKGNICHYETGKSESYV